MIQIYNYGEFLFSTKQALKEQCVWTRAFASVGDWDMSACEQQGSCPYFHTFGTSLSTACYFGWASLHLEMIQLSKSIMGPSLVMLSPTSVKVTQRPGEGHRQGGRLWLAISASSASVRFWVCLGVDRKQVCVVVSAIQPWRRSSLLTGGPYWQMSAQAQLELCASRDPLYVCTRKWEPRWKLNAGLQGPGV